MHFSVVSSPFLRLFQVTPGLMNDTWNLRRPDLDLVAPISQGLIFISRFDTELVGGFNPFEKY